MNLSDPFLFDVPVVKGRRQHFNPKPHVPDTGWVRPTTFPDLSGAGAISFDVETKDPDLRTHGAGWGRGKGHIIGLAVATDDGFMGYYPVRHEEEGVDNFPVDQVFRWAKEQLTRPHQWKVAHNSLYDVGWLMNEGITVQGPIWDTWIGEKLIHHRQEAALEATGQRRVGKGKKSTLLLRWLHQFYGRGKMPEDDDLDESQKGNLFRAPPRLVGPYAESDVTLPLEIAGAQEAILERNGLMEVFELENALTPLLAEIRFHGVRVDTEAAYRADRELSESIKQLHAEIRHLAGRHIEVNSGDDVGKMLAALGVKVPTTPKTKKYSVTDELLDALDLPVAEKIAEVRELIKFQGTFIRGAVLDSQVRGRVHCNFNPLQAITGRFSSSDPNLQNIPSRNPKLMLMVRSIFGPDEGHHAWRKEDYKAIESRLLGHFAVGKNSEALREEYRQNPDTDYHNFTTNLIRQETGLELPRKAVKNVNFAIIYGASQKKLSRMLKLGKDEVEPFFQAYHQGMPYVAATMEHFSQLTARNGFTQTILGRRAEFDGWEPNFWQGESYVRKTLSFEEAVEKFGTRIRRAGLHRAVNYTIQGSAADLLKKAMLKCWKDGIYNYTGNPLLLVHDEKDFSVRDWTTQTQEAFREMKHIMETVIEFKVPIKVESEMGRSWGETEKVE